MNILLHIHKGGDWNSNNGISLSFKTKGVFTEKCQGQYLDRVAKIHYVQSNLRIPDYYQQSTCR